VCQVELAGVAGDRFSPNAAMAMMKASDITETM
jgi:hypothetical protein